MTIGQFACIPRAAASSSLNNGALRVLIAIASFAGRERQAYPSFSQISERTGISREHIPREIKRLVSAGFLIVEKQTGRRNLYTITDPQIQEDVADIGDTNTGVAKTGVASLGSKESPTQAATYIEDSDHKQTIRETPTASPNGSKNPPDNPLKTFWRNNTASLVALGIPEAQARTMIGKWRSKFSDVAVSHAIEAACRGEVTEPISYVYACLSRPKVERDQFSSPGFS